jgi:hypothetical protein
MLNRSGDSGHPCLVPDFNIKFKNKEAVTITVHFHFLWCP